MKIIELLETPIEDYQLIGDFSKGKSFNHPVDRKLLMHPKNTLKVYKMFSKTPYNFRIYPINEPGLRQFSEIGSVSIDWLRDNIPTAHDFLQKNPIKDDEIVIFYVSNTGVDKVILTPWMMAHRFGHAIRIRNIDWADFESNMNTMFQSILKEFFNVKIHSNSRKSFPAFIVNHLDELKILFNNIGTMRSARSRSITRPYEFLYEMLAQWLVTGDIKFNNITGPISYNRKWLNPNDIEELNNYLDTLARDISTYYFPNILNSAEGQIYVM